MVAELEDTSARRMRPSRSSSGLSRSSTSRTHPRPAYRHSLPTIIDEASRHMRTWNLDATTQTWRPSSPALSALRAGGSRSNPDLATHASRGQDVTPTSHSVLLAELSTNFEIREEMSLIAGLHGHLSKYLAGPSGSTMVLLQPPNPTLCLDGSFSPCSVLRIYTSRKFDKVGTIERTIRSIRLIVSDLLAMPMATSSVLIVPTARAEMDQMGAYPFPRSQDWMAQGPTMTAEMRKSKQDAARVNRRTSMPQVPEHPHGAHERRHGFPGVLRPRNSTRIAPGLIQSPTGSMSPLSPLSRSKETEAMFGHRRPNSRHGRVPSGSQPRKRNTLKKRSVDGFTSPSARRGSRGSFNSPRLLRSARRDHSPSSLQNLKPARPTQLTTSRMSWSGADRCKVPDAMDTKRHSMQRTSTTVSDVGNGTDSAEETTPNDIEKPEVAAAAPTSALGQHEDSGSVRRESAVVVRRDSKRGKVMKLLTRVMGRH